MDKKTQQTKKLLADSLKSIMAIKALNKISIREICEESGFNRQTFYYHFEDIFDLVKWMFRKDTELLLQQTENLLFWQESLLQLFQYIESNRAVCLCALESMGRVYLKQFFSDVISKAVFVMGHELPVESKKYMEFLAQYYTVAMVGLLESWVLGELEETPEQVVEYFSTIVNDQFQGAVLRNQADSLSGCF
ncbi:TetR/AcrR family transcriptional regulator [Clostridia bacterium]|nr:TetR/AcrR family transcriptional regulator [Clostridia bacterium]